MTIDIRLLGTIDIRLKGQPLTLPPTHKAQSLLAYLIVNRSRPWPREQLATLFWPDRPRDKALHSLNTALWQIRRALACNGYLVTDAHTIQFNPDCDYWLDVQEFEARAKADRIDCVQRAIELYQGDFLEGFYDDWCLEERYRLEALYLLGLERLSDLSADSDDADAALGYVRRLLAHDPLREDVHRRAMGLYAQRGDRASVLQQYGRCRAALRDQLSLQPALETTALCMELTGEAPTDLIELGITTHLQAAAPSFDPSCVPLAERAQALATLQQTWEQARAGRGCLLLILGGAGIGKTRLINEFANRVRWAGGRVANGTCYEYEQPQPYHPVTDILRAILSWLPLNIARALPAWALVEIARLAPEINDRLNRSLPDEVSESPFQQSRLLHALVFFLQAAASTSPLLLVFDDLHWASDSTLTFLQYITPRLCNLPVLIVGACRCEEMDQNHALPTLLRRLERRDLALGLSLNRLSIEGVTGLLRQVSAQGSAIDPFARRLHNESQGNPFFLMELIRELFETGDLRNEAGAWQADWLALAQRELSVPHRVEELILARASRLTSVGQATLEAAAVAGQEFDFGIVEQASGLNNEEATLAALEELLRRQFIVEAQGSAKCDYAFTHPMLRETVYANLHHLRRRRLHRLIALAMEQAYAGQPDLADTLAYHFERAGASEKALYWLVEAGQQARRNHAPREALSHFRRAVAHLTPNRSDVLAARALTGLAVAQREVVGDEQSVATWLNRALSIWQALDEPAGIAEAWYALAHHHADCAQARAMIQQGLDAAQRIKGSPELIVRGYGLMARFFEHEGDYLNTRIWTLRQMELSQQIDSPHELAYAHHRLGSLISRVGGPMSEALRHEQTAAHLAEELGWLDFAAGSHNIAGYCLLALGQTRQAEAECRTALQLSLVQEIPWRQCWAYHYLAEIAIRRGDGQAAVQALERAEQLVMPQPDHFQEIALQRTRAHLATLTGDVESARSLTIEALELSRRFYTRYVPLLELELAGLDIGERDNLSVQRRIEHARSQADQFGMAYVAALADRLSGQTAALNGKVSAVDDAFAASLQQFEQLEQVIEIARTQLAWATVSLKRDPPRARSLLAAAFTAFEVAEAVPEAARVKQLWSTLG